MKLALAAIVFALVMQGPAPAPEAWSELEQARLDALAQEGRALDAEQRTLTLMREQWTAKVARFKAEAEAKRPGYAWNSETGQWSQKPKEAK